MNVENEPWGLARLEPFGPGTTVTGKPSRVDARTQMALWRDVHGRETILDAKHRATQEYTKNTTQRQSDGTKEGRDIDRDVGSDMNRD